MTMHRLATAIVLGVALGLAAGCAGFSADKAGGQRVRTPVVLTLVDGENGLSVAQPFADAVNRLSKGTVRVVIKSSWRRSDPRYEIGLIRDVQAGKAQLGITATRAFNSVGIDSFQALQAPFLIDNVALEQRVLSSDLQARMLGGLGQAGLVGLVILPGPLRRPLGFGHALRSLADYHGRTIGIRPSLVSQELFWALGATAVALQRGTQTSGAPLSGLDGIESNLATISSGYDVPGAILTGNVVFEPRPDAIFMNRAAFDSLSAGQRSVLLRAAAEARTAGVFAPDPGPLRDLCRRGMRIVDASSAELAALRRAVRSVYTALDRDPSTKQLITRIMMIRRAAGGSPDSVRCESPAGTSQSTTRPTRLDGTWQVAFTRSEFIAAGAAGDEVCCENWGHFTLKFHRGRWSETGTKPGQSLMGSGTYVVTGNTITMDRNDHAYPGSDTEIWGPFTWSVYRDTLTLKKQPSGPTGLIVKPWRKVGP